ncbi:MAG: hypothetical protein V1725_06905 [archaeon]
MAVMNTTLTVVEGMATNEPVLWLVLGIVLYVFIIFAFYKFMATRDILKLNLVQYNTTEHPLLKNAMHVLLYVVEYIMIFPILAVLWFFILTCLLLFLVRDQSVAGVLLVSAAMVAAVRATSYINEEVAQELAKLLPLVLLGVLLIDSSYWSANKVYDFLDQLPTLLTTMVYYVIFIIVIEILMRLAYTAAKPWLKE